MDQTHQNEIEDMAKSHKAELQKKPYSTPRLVNLGAIHGVVMGGACFGSDGGNGCNAS
jgi:hypothetical protein